MTKHRIYTTSVASVYPHYVAKAEKKGRTRSEVDEVIRWLTGYNQIQLETQLERQLDFETFFSEAPQLNPSRASIKGVVCGVRVEDIEEPTMREIADDSRRPNDVDGVSKGPCGRAMSVGRWRWWCGDRL